MSATNVSATIARHAAPRDGQLPCWRQALAFTLALSLHLVTLQALPGFYFAEARIPAVQDISVHLLNNASPKPVAVSVAVSPAKNAREKARDSTATGNPLPAPTPMPVTGDVETATPAVAASAVDTATVPAASAPTDPPPTSAAHVDTRYLDNPAPAYPPLSRRLGETGQVMLQVQVSATGSVLDIAVEQSSGYPRLDAAARAAVMKWRFVPARQGEETIGSRVRVPMRFGLEP